jgi:hypothetical protein
MSAVAGLTQSELVALNRQFRIAHSSVAPTLVVRVSQHVCAPVHALRSVLLFDLMSRCVS